VSIMTVTEAATLIVAVSGLVVAVGTAFVGVWNAVHLAQVHTLVNSMATRTESLQRALGHAQGIGDAERASTHADPPTRAERAP